MYKPSLVSLRYAPLLIACVVPLLCLPAKGLADAQVSARAALGAGKRWADIGDEPVFEAAIRGEAMFGEPRHRTFRLGPGFELRSMDFESVEGAAGAGMLVPTGDFALGLTGLVGYAARRQAPDGVMGIANVTWGYRGYNYHHWYGWGLNFFVSARRSLSGDEVFEVTGGVEVDLMFVTVVPILAIRNAFTGGDPHQNP